MKESIIYASWVQIAQSPWSCNLLSQIRAQWRNRTGSVYASEQVQFSSLWQKLTHLFDSCFYYLNYFLTFPTQAHISDL